MEVVNVVPMPVKVHQSRWGFHPTSRETDKKLRFLNGVYQKALSRASAWTRWNNKSPSNRFTRKRIRNEKGQTIGYGDKIQWNEPNICPIFSNKITKKVNINPINGQYFKNGIDWTVIETFNQQVSDSAFRSRMPYVTAQEVKPLPLSTEKIDVLYDQAKNWMENVG